MRRSVTLRPDQVQYLMDEYGGISPAIRALIDADIAKRSDAAQAPNEDEQRDGGQGDE
jgi:hypothetical protein